ncbi:hypothetical protein BU26DRAFT_523221 [Trematosphaeria pertusa]|uniref:Uncharacterized protein n=1 Tax=Trematosphaeria pertusa TaxID=390896 RepID=A0A6A6HZK3_9PLEO|nr:uncharacterized protein BU26DRAFT_523221 [Trematosphaeria pertusa]KAF2243625.1 hypothetical protein BU26DRAFT_523221 [Trematosphaeria pertusa]
MASSPTALAHPMPLRSPDAATIDLRHPTPDLQSLQGAYIGNIERLEEHAERMSEQGSDLGEEIRKLQLEQKLSESRRSSLRSAPPVEEHTRHFSTRSRNASTSSYTNSIVDVNGNARWGGYSPGGYVTSPVGSLRSGSLSQAPPARQRSESKTSRLGQIVHAEEEEEEPQAAVQQPDSPQSHQSVRSPLRDNSPPPPSHRSVSSFTRQYDKIAQEIQDELQQSMTLEEHLGHQQLHRQPASFEDHPRADFPDRPATAASTDTTHKMRHLWQDFDGVHCPDTVPEEEPEQSHASGSRASSMLKSAPELPPQGAPPPDDGMVFYPAPVPKLLNLPQRLSKVPAANVQARRRTQLLESMHAENRKSAALLPEVGGEPSKPNRKSRQSLANLPPQLRASAYFDQVAPAQEFEVQGESAEDTLNSILEASAHAPVSAFTDHPFAGHVGDEVYGREHRRKVSKANEPEKIDNRKSRSSLNLLDTRRNSSGDPLNKLKKRNSSADLNMLTVRASESRMSLGDELEHPDPDARGPELGGDETLTGHSVDGEHILPQEDEEEEEGEEEQEEQFFGQPTTLLAELQMRKQQQKSRNLTAATAFPNGMHATLLELDAVAEIEKKKRRGQKVNLAWEAQAPPAEDDDSDDDVPLGVLFPGRDGLVNKKAGPATQQDRDWDRPLGLIAQRELEDNEPLSRRRTRLVGGRPRDTSPSKRQTQLLASQSQQYLAVPSTTTPHPESEEDEGETLAERMRRIRERKALDDAIGVDVRKSTVSGDFAAEMMSQFGVNEEEKAKPAASPANEGEEETLGQRRARLQAEALARGDVNPRGSRPPLRASMSMADILSSHPIDPTNQARKVSNEQLLSSLPQGSLLRQNAEKQERLKASRLDQNNRISSYGSLDQPLLGGNVGKAVEDQPIAAKIQAYKEKMSGGNTPMTAPPTMQHPSMMFNGQMMGGLTPSMSTMNLPGQRDSYFPQPNMGMMGMNGMGVMPNGFGFPGNNMMMAPQMMPMSMNMGMMGMPTQGMMYPQMGGMGAMAGMRQSSMMNLPTMQMQQPVMVEAPMDPRQRDVIDRWRQSVMP